MCPVESCARRNRRWFVGGLGWGVEPLLPPPPPPFYLAKPTRGTHVVRGHEATADEPSSDLPYSELRSEENETNRSNGAGNGAENGARNGTGNGAGDDATGGASSARRHPAGDRPGGVTISDEISPPSVVVAPFEASEWRPNHRDGLDGGRRETPTRAGASLARAHGVFVLEKEACSLARVAGQDGTGRSGSGAVRLGVSTRCLVTHPWLPARDPDATATSRSVSKSGASPPAPRSPRTGHRVCKPSVALARR